MKAEVRNRFQLDVSSVPKGVVLELVEANAGDE